VTKKHKVNINRGRIVDERRLADFKTMVNRGNKISFISRSYAERRQKYRTFAKLG